MLVGWCRVFNRQTLRTAAGRVAGPEAATFGTERAEAKEARMCERASAAVFGEQGAEPVTRSKAGPATRHAATEPGNATSPETHQ